MPGPVKAASSSRQEVQQNQNKQALTESRNRLVVRATLTHTHCVAA